MNRYMSLRKFYEIEKFVTILKSDECKDDHAWRRSEHMSIKSKPTVVLLNICTIR